MHINITDSTVANNKGSSGQLVHYLEKENRISEAKDPELWFNHTGSSIEPFEVRRALDANVAKLSKSDAKFFLVNISPSQKELKFLKGEFGKAGMREQLKLFAQKVMDEYAKNFKRDGVESAEDLLWFAKVERHRYYSHRDPEMVNGSKRRGERKEGNQMHVQVIVSRKDATNSIKLSPMNKSRGKNEGHSKKLGQFDRVAFKQSGETVFDKMFGFDRGLKETMAFANVTKKGNISQREQMAVLELAASKLGSSDTKLNGLAREVNRGKFPSVGHMLEGAGKTVSEFVEMMMERADSVAPDINPVEQAEKRRRRQQAMEQGLGL